jgi:hypothetical protein
VTVQRRHLDEKSERNLSQCHRALQDVIRTAHYLSPIPFAVLHGHRGEAAQNRAFEMGRTKKRWPDGNHNKLPSTACDVAPLPINWSDEPKNLARFYQLGAIILTVAGLLGIEIRGGWDWDRDLDLTDQTFDDLGHVELAKGETDE